MKKIIKEAALDTVGMALIGAACIAYHDGKTDGLEGLELFVLVFFCAIPVYIGRSILKRSAKCAK